AIARGAFGAADDERAEALRFLEIYIWRASRPSEMPSIARAVQRFRPSLSEAIYLESVIRWILEDGVSDPRGFSQAGLDLISRFGDLDEYDRALGARGSTLMRGLRRYLVDRLSDARCSDSLTEGPTVEAFNTLVRRRDLDADDVRQISVSE